MEKTVPNSSEVKRGGSQKEADHLMRSEAGIFVDGLHNNELQGTIDINLSRNITKKYETVVGWMCFFLGWCWGEFFVNWFF